ncbi:hypothetical protein KCP77_14315 [Salmonella enterica subsp. enterica]|nr:hypothetical protein KCP77_14315 [Salmonella enterica subsp. enterica]
MVCSKALDDWAQGVRRCWASPRASPPHRSISRYSAVASVQEEFNIRGIIPVFTTRAPRHGDWW